MGEDGRCPMEWRASPAGGVAGDAAASRHRVSDHRMDERRNGGKRDGHLSHVYGGGRQERDRGAWPGQAPSCETLKTCTGCSLQVNAPSEFSDFHPAPRRRWMTMISGQIDIQLADGTIYGFGPEDLRLWEDVTGGGPSDAVSRCSQSVSRCPYPTNEWSLVKPAVLRMSRVDRTLSCTWCTSYWRSNPRL